MKVKSVQSILNNSIFGSIFTSIFFAESKKLARFLLYIKCQIKTDKLKRKKTKYINALGGTI